MKFLLRIAILVLVLFPTSIGARHAIPALCNSDAAWTDAGVIACAKA